MENKQNPIKDEETERDEQNQETQESEENEGQGMDPETKVRELEAILEEQNEKYLRLYSEFDNYRKRTGKERIEIINTAGSEIITTLLPVLDDFERAMKSAEETTDMEAYKEGVNLIYNKLNSTLSRKGLETMKSIGEPFDPEYHEAITNLPAPSENMIGKVIDEVEKGYLLNGKVIRYAKVIVGN